MANVNFNEVFGNKFDELEQKLQGKSTKVVSTSDSKEYELYDLFLEYKSILEDYYENNIKNYYTNYKNFIYYFNQFLLRFQLHGIDFNFEPHKFKDCNYVNIPLMYSGDFINYFQEFINFNDRDISGTFLDTEYFLKRTIAQLDIIKNYVRSNQNNKVLDSSLLIMNSDDFAKIVFSYSSYSALMASVDTYSKSVHSGKIKEILSSIETAADPSSFFTGVKCPMGRWPTEDRYPESLQNFLKLTWHGVPDKHLDDIKDLSGAYGAYGELHRKLGPIGTTYMRLESTDGRIFWISESGINIVNSIMNNLIAENSENNFDLVYIKCGNEYMASVLRDGTNVNEVLRSLNLSKDTFLSNKFFSNFSNKKAIGIKNIIYKIILEQNNLILPIISSICIKKVDNVKNKYIKTLNISMEEANLIFEEVYYDYSIDRIFSEFSYNAYGEATDSFSNNRSIIRDIIDNDGVYLTRPSKYDYVELFKKCIDHDAIANNIREAVAAADKEVDISEIFSKDIVANYSNLIKQTYENPNSIIYSNLEENLYKNKINLNLIKQISQSISINTPYNEDSNIIDLQTVYKKSLDLDLNLNLKILRFSSRLDFLNGRSYKEFIESEKEKTQKIEDELNNFISLPYNRSNLNNKVIESQKLIILLSKLITDNFKKEGQLLQSNSDQELTVKIPEYSEEKKTEVFIPKNISFAKLSVLLRLLNKAGVNLPHLFSEFLDDLVRLEKSDHSHGSNYNSSFLASADIPIILALFWMKKLSKPEEISSTESLERNLLSFLENLPLMMSIFEENHTLQAIVRVRQDRAMNSMADAFIKQSKFSKIETFKNLSSLIKFYHNNERVWDLPYLISDSKNLNKLYLNNYQVFLQSFIDFNSLLRDGNNYLSPSELKEKIYNLKEKLKNDPNIGPEKTEKLLPQDKIDGIQFFKLETCEMTADSFDEAFDKMEGNFDPKNIASLNNIISTVKQIETIKQYISYAKPRVELVLDNNYMFAGSNNYKFRFRTLGDLDSQHFSIGVDTGCCQRIGGIGEAAAIDSFINPAASVIILEVNNNSEWNIISQSYFHVVSEGNYFILDNIEAGKYNNHSLKSMIGFNFFEVYSILAKELLAKGFKKVLCGMGYTKVLLEDASKFKIHEMDKDPRHFEVEEKEISEKYTDFMSNGSRKSFDLGSPNFEIPEVGKLVFAASTSFKVDLLLKISNSILIKKTDNLNLIKLSKYLNSVNLTTYSSRVLLLER